MNKSIFVTGTDTNVGKTVLSALLVAALDATYWKPIQTGACEGTDRQAVMNYAGIPEERTLPESYCFDPPVSPHLAAAAAGVKIDLARIQAPEFAAGKRIIVEGAGGILVPVNDSEFMLDLARMLAVPVLIASRTTLGTINHTALTARAVKCAGIAVTGVVMIGDRSRENERSIEQFAAVPIVGRIPRLESINRNALLQVFRSDFDHAYFQ
jgi:dethiobiotin synthetase